MRSQQQKQIESEGEFQQIREEIQTLNTQTYAPITKYKTVRKSKFSQKARLTQLARLQPFLSQNLQSPSKVKQNFLPFGKIIKIGSFTFRSNYQCGHIGGVQLIGTNQFKIDLDLESNSMRENTWFYFTVEGVKGEARFFIQGFTKRSSLYNNGMKVCYRDGKQGKWRRGGVNIKYVHTDSEQDNIFQLQFSYFFKSNENSSVQFAYAFPYGWNKLQNLITNIHGKAKIHVLGRTYDGRQIPLITAGNCNSQEAIILTSRVHPGQTCSSLIIQGLLKQLLSNNQHSKFLCENYYLKIVPMINIDGVSKGNYRFSSAGVDLNRKWKTPHEHYHPQIFYLKQMILAQNKQRKVKMYIDMHGHSRKKNVFFYGCCKKNDQLEQYTNSKAFPYLMSKLHNAFSYFDSSFNIEKQKEGTARISMWKQLKIDQIYTLEASMCGSQVGHNYLQADYQKIGKKLCEGISIYFSSKKASDSPVIKKLSKFNQQVILALKSDPQLLKIGNQSDYGSQSEPQKGEIPPQELKQAKNGEKRLKNLSNGPKMKKKQNGKEKHQPLIPQKQLVKEKQSFEYLFQFPHKKTTKDNISFVMAKKRVNSVSRNNNYRAVVKSITYNQDETDMTQQKFMQKTKANLLLGWQGAQYRRVRKMAEQNWKRQSSMGQFAVKGLRGNKIQIDHTRTLIPKLSFNIQQIKNRRTTAQMFFKKSQKNDEIIPLSQQQNVLCRGRQIML